MRYHVQAEIYIAGDDSILTAVSGLKAATIIVNSEHPAQVIAVSSGRPRVGMIAPYPAPGLRYAGTGMEPPSEVEGGAPEYAKGCSLSATLDCGDVPDAVSAVVALDVILHEMQDWYQSGPFSKDPAITVELSSVSAYAGPVDMFEKMPELMKLAGKYMRRGIDRGDGDGWKPEDDDEEDGGDTEP